MKFIRMEEKGGGRYIRRYDLTYETEAGREKVYEIISRRRGMHALEELSAHAPDAVILIVFDEAGRLLLSREYRLAVGAWVYSFPAGLIDPGETPEEAAARELREETGLRLEEVWDTLPPAFSATGFADETTLTVIGRAAGEFGKSSSDEEEIAPGWYTKEEVRALLKTGSFASRAQTWCWLWSQQ